MQRIVILNPKGGSGKTTIATNLAASYAAAGELAALVDLDPQGSSTRWLSKRTLDQTPIHGIAAFQRPTGITRSWQMRVPPECTTVIVDTPAAVNAQTMPELTRGADAILVPVMPSDIDIHAAAKCVTDLLLVAKVRRADDRIGIVANRVKSNTLISKSLTRFLSTLEIPLIATLRDTQNYVRSAEIGLGLHEMPLWRVREDLEQWNLIKSWLSRRFADPVEPIAEQLASTVA